MAAPKLTDVSQVPATSASVVELLERLLEKAKAGEIRAVAAAWEYPNGGMGHEAAFSEWANRFTMIGKLQVMATHITLNECLEWKPG
jgi:hypothetical protein